MQQKYIACTQSNYKIKLKSRFNCSRAWNQSIEMLGRRELVKMGHFTCVRYIYGAGILSDVFVRALSWCICVCAWELSSFTQIIFKLSTLLAIQKKPINYNWNKCFLIRLLCDWWHTLSFSPRFVYFSWNYRHFLCKVFSTLNWLWFLFS